MTRIRRWQAASLLAALSLVAGAGAAAAARPATTYVSREAGFKITVPNDWKYVPNTVEQIRAEVTALEKHKQTALASIYRSIISTAAGRNAVGSFAFDAFLYPPISATPTEIVLGIARTTVAYTPKALGPTFARQLASTPGAKIGKPENVSLPAGPAVFIAGTNPDGTTGRGGFELYLIPHGKMLYELSLHAAANDISRESIFASVARDFGFV